MYTSIAQISLTLKLKTVLQIKNWNTPLILTPHSTRNWFRSHTQKVVSYMQHSTIFHLTYFQSVAGVNKFQISLNRAIPNP